MSELSGKQLGQYELLNIIGKGGMATVYRAYQPSMDRDVAIKVMSPDLAEDPEFIARFEREGQIIAKLQHPHILPVYDFGRSDGLAYLVMRLVMGGNLAEELQSGAQPMERVLTLTHQIAAALEYAHLRGIVHRDLKPTNVLLDDMGNAYLTDFGIAKLLAGGPTTGLTATGAVMGTPTYMAPEQWRAEPVDGRTDIYALGVILYQMLLGQVPFAAETPHGLMYQHLDKEPPPPHTLKPDLPLSIEPVIAKALAKKPEERYASAADLVKELERALQAPPRLPEQTDFEA
ncbi:MAG: serine/threonine protein kinase, partial [Anaerolineae bacterium]|nr:serine/threonine protein kinase [Anaerolineae bacterium]